MITGVAPHPTFALLLRKSRDNPLEDIPITLSKQEWELIIDSLTLLDRQLVDLSIKGNAGKREWTRIHEIENVVRSIQYGIVQFNLDSENNV